MQGFYFTLAESNMLTFTDFYLGGLRELSNFVSRIE